MGKKKAGKESKEEDDQRQGSTRSGRNYQPRTSEPSAERGAAICTKGHLTPRAFSLLKQEKGEDDKTGPTTRAQQPTAQDTSDEPHTAASCGELQFAETAQGTGDDWISELCAKLSATADLDEEPQWDLYGWVQKESHPTWKDTSSGKREFDSEWDDWTYERRCNDEALSGDTFNEELWAWLQHLIAQSNMTEEDRRRLTWAVRDLRRADYDTTQAERKNNLQLEEVNCHLEAVTAAVRAKAERLELENRQLKTDLQQAREVAAAAIAAAAAHAADNPAAATVTAGTEADNAADSAADSAVVNPAAAAAQAAVAGADATAADNAAASAANVTPAAAAAKAAAAGTIAAGAAAANGALMGGAATQMGTVVSPAAAAAQAAVAGAGTTAATNTAASAATVAPAAAAAKAAAAGTIAAGTAAANGALTGGAATQMGTGVYIPGGSGQLTANEARLLQWRDAAEQAAQNWHWQCAKLQHQCNNLQGQCSQAWAMARENELSARHWKATAETIAAHHQYQPPIPPQLSTLEATHPSSILRPESVATGPATVPTPMAVDQRSGLEMGRDSDRDNAAAANVAAAADAAAADAAAAALAAAATATKVAAAARDTTQFRAAVKAAAAIAVALVTCQAANGQIGHTAANSAAAHRRGGNRPPRGPGARPGLRRRRAAAETARPAETTQTQTAGGGRPPRTRAKKRREPRPRGWNGARPGPADSDRPGATQRPTQAGAHSSSSHEAEPALFGSDHAPPHNGARVRVTMRGPQ